MFHLQKKPNNFFNNNLRELSAEGSPGEHSDSKNRGLGIEKLLPVLNIIKLTEFPEKVVNKFIRTFSSEKYIKNNQSKKN